MALVVTLCGHTPAAVASPNRDSPIVGQIGGRIGPVDAFGNYVVFSEAARLIVADTTENTRPAVVARSIVLPDDISDVVVSGTRAFVAWRWGVSVFDLSDPRRPTQVSEFSTEYVAQHVAVVGNNVYVAGRGLWVVDMSQPEPELLAWIDTPLSRGIAANESAVFLLTDAGVSILHIDERNIPTEVTTIQTEGTDVALDAAMLYIVGGAGLTIYDVSQPAHPRSIGDLVLPGAPWLVAVSGETAYIVANALELLVVDVSDPSAAKQIGRTEWIGLPRGLVVGQNTAYVTFGDLALEPAGLRLVDVTTPNAPKAVGVVPSVGPIVAADVRDQRAYVVTSERDPLSSGLRVIDVADSVSTDALGWLDWGSGTQAVHPFDLVVHEGLAYVVVGEGLPNLMPTEVVLRVVRVREPDRPHEVGRVHLSSGVPAFGDLLYDSGRLFLSAGLVKVLVVDVTHGEQPSLEASLDVPRHVDIAVWHDLIFLVTDDARLLMTSVDTPGSFEEVGTVGAVRSVAVGTAAMYVSAGDRLEVYRLSEGTPQRVEVVKAPGELARMTVWSQLLYALSPTGQTAYVFNVVDPEHPTAIATLGLGYRVTRLIAGTGRFYGLTRGGALLVLVPPFLLEQRVFLPSCTR